MSAPAREHWLLTVLGVTPTPATYALEGREAEASLAPVALLNLLPKAQRPTRALAVCTPDAMRDSWPRFRDDVGGLAEAEQVEIDDAASQDGVEACLRAVTRSIPENADLTVDVTHGFRHFSFLAYAAVLYLAALRGVTVRGAWYGLFRRGASSPFLDLAPLLALPRWIHALETLRETAAAAPFAALLRGGSGSVSQATEAVARDVSHFSDAYLSGLALEAGHAAREVRERRRKPLRRALREHRLPLAMELAERFERILEPFALDADLAGDGRKTRIALSERELARQARHVDDLLRRDNTDAALGLMNEWTVSWAVLRAFPGAEWLNFTKVRRKAARKLDAMAAIGDDPELRGRLTDEQIALGAFWRRLRGLRNAWRHSGMRPQLVVGNREVAGDCVETRKYWEGTLRDCPDIPLPFGESPDRRVLVSPVGMRPGVLFSALRACRSEGPETDWPTACLVLCSHETKESIDEAARRAGYDGGIERFVFRDPHGGGRDEIDALGKKARPLLVGAAEVRVNVTGGTTLMGLAAEAFAAEARSLACPTRRFGLIDRRPPGEQDADPWQEGEAFWLDDPAEDGDGG